MNEFAPFDVVRLPAGIVEFGVPEDALAVVIEVHYDPYVAYEIEVADDSGVTVFAGAVDPACLELVQKWRQSSADPSPTRQVLPRGRTCSEPENPCD